MMTWQVSITEEEGEDKGFKVDTVRLHKSECVWTVWEMQKIQLKE